MGADLEAELGNRLAVAARLLGSDGRSELDVLSSKFGESLGTGMLLGLFE